LSLLSFRPNPDGGYITDGLDAAFEEKARTLVIDKEITSGIYKLEYAVTNVKAGEICLYFAISVSRSVLFRRHWHR
jgi:hypothetical protein